MLFTDLLQICQEAVGRRVKATLPLHRFNDDRSNAARETM
jgi:hypothetical protein